MDDPVARFQKSQEELEAVIARFSDEELTTPGKLGDWSLREVLAHIAAWDRWGQRAIEVRLTENDLPANMLEEARNPDPFNARAAEAWKGYDARQARADFAEAYNDLISFLKATPHEKLYRQIPRPNGKTTNPTASLTALARHKDEHRALLEELLANQ
ncbi:MAG TPA: maleylpyruvate isomerase N-terminal domain-containing protein [Ktedonobacterales bacterium]|jgi:uncharacterized protein (TIGR03083 family)